jgi:trans-aconitate methyltransferase
MLMQRTLEPELMLDHEQAIAYSEADFSESDERFVRRFQSQFDLPLEGEIFDLGCGPGNIALRMANAFPGCSVTGVDGASAMLDIARSRASQMSNISLKPHFLQAVLPSDALPLGRANAVVSNSLLHHLHDPLVLWRTIKQVSAPNAAVLIVDLRRPETTEIAHRIVDTYARGEPEILLEDFYNSLLAAFEVNEVKNQLDLVGLTELKVQAVGDRYLEVFGRMPG